MPMPGDLKIPVRRVEFFITGTGEEYLVNFSYNNIFLYKDACPVGIKIDGKNFK